MFSLYNSGTVLPTGKLTLENYKVMLDFLLTAEKRKAHLPSGKINMFYAIKLSLVFLFTNATRTYTHTLTRTPPHRHRATHIIFQ